MHKSLVFLLVLLSPFLLLQPTVGAQTAATTATAKPKQAQPAKTAAVAPAKSTATKSSTTTKATVATPAKAKPAPAPATTAKKAAPPAPAATATRSVNPAKAKPPRPAVTVQQPTTAAKPQKQAKQSSRSRAVAATPAAHRPACNTVVDIDKQISARSVMVLDAASGEPIFAKMPDNPRQPASTIKIVTAMIAIEALHNDDIVEVSRHAAEMPSSKVFLQTGKTYRADDLINAVLLESANDAAVALGEKIGGSEEKFANLMTISARMWGAQNTECRTASGLTAVGQQSTARDLANLFRFAMQHEPFAERMKEKNLRTSYGKNLRNHNKALWKIDGAVGGKTGYTVAARQTYVGMFSRDGRSIVVAIMGSESMWADLAKLVEYGFQKLPSAAAPGTTF